MGSVLYRSPSHAWSAALGREFELDEVAVAAAVVSAAASALAAGHIDLARRLWASPDGDRLLKLWNDGNEAADALGLPWASSRPSTKPSVEVSQSQIGESQRRRIFVRDDYRCLYCGIPVVTKWRNGHISRLVAAFPEMSKYLSVVGGSLRRIDGGALRNEDCRKWIWFEASADHLVPRSRGGSNEDGNLVTACGGCNYSKQDYLLGEMGVEASAPLRKALQLEG